MTEESKATFSLYTVLAFILFLGMLVSGFLWNALATGKAERIATNIQVEARLTRLEANFAYIVQGITELKVGQDKAAEMLAKHESNSAIIKKWQDYPSQRVK